MKILKGISRLFQIRKYQKEMKLSPLFIETTVSIFAGLFMLFWGIIFFSNKYYQFSIFTKLRNEFVSIEKEEQALSGIYCMGLDAKYELILRDKNIDFTKYDMIADSISVISEYAEVHPEKRIVIGIDYAFTAKIGDNSFQRLILAVSNIPENLFIVFGGILLKQPENVAFLRPDLLETELIYPASDIAKDPFLADRIFMANIHYIKGSIRSGFENEEEFKAALGYIPLYVHGQNISFLYSSLPFCMYVVGEIMEKTEQGRYDFWTDFAMGQVRFDSNTNIQSRIEQKVGKSFDELIKPQSYNFFTNKNINAFKQNFLWLSNHSLFIDFSLPLEKYFKFRIATQLELEGREMTATTRNIEYFFIAPVDVPEFLLGEGDTNDIIITPASKRDEFANEIESVSGVMAHIVALSNLLNKFYINTAPDWLFIIFSFLMVGGVFFISWNNDLFKTIFYTFILIIFLIVLSFIFFLFGLFIPLSTPLALSVMVFALIAIGRFIYTTNKLELYELVASRVFSPSQMKKLKIMQEKGDWRQAKIVQEGIIMAIFPKRLPDLGKNDEEAGAYTKIYEKYLKIIFDIIARYGGSHDTLSMDGVLGFWNVPVWEEGSISNFCFACMPWRNKPASQYCWFS